jgi:hypothetical protein
MSELAGAGRLRALRRPHRDRGSRTARELFARLGRAMLWLAVAVVLMRGLAGTFASQRTRPAHTGRVARVVAWPNDVARAFAVEFTTAYLDRPAGEDPGDYAQRVAALASPGLAELIAPRLDPRATTQTVRSTAVAGAEAVDRGRALITVAASVVAEGESRIVRLTVPVARDDAGRLVVDDLPSLAPAPARASVGPPDGEPLLGNERAAITDVVTRVLRAYLAGDARGLAYLAPAGVRLGAASGGFELVEITSLATLGRAWGARRLVLATVQVRDRVSRALLALRYRVRLIKRDRWYVAELNGPQEG